MQEYKLGEVKNEKQPQKEEVEETKYKLLTSKF